MKELWQSTVDFHKRFDNLPPSLPSALKAFQNKSRGVIGELLPFDINLSILTEECVDVIVACMGLILAAGGTLDDLEAAVRKVIAKNDAKTTETHEKVYGVIKRVNRENS